MAPGGGFLRLCNKSWAKGHLLSSPKIVLCALLANLPVCIKGRDPRGIVKVVGQDSGVVIESKKVISAIDLPLLTFRELWEPGGKETLRVWGSSIMLWEENVLGEGWGSTLNYRPGGDEGGSCSGARRGPSSRC